MVLRALQGLQDLLEPLVLLVLILLLLDLQVQLVQLVLLVLLVRQDQQVLLEQQVPQVPLERTAQLQDRLDLRVQQVQLDQRDLVFPQVVQLVSS